MSGCRAGCKMANERSSSDYPERDGTSSRSLQQPSMIGSEERLETNCSLVSKMRVQMASVYRARTIVWSQSLLGSRCLTVLTRVREWPWTVIG